MWLPETKKVINALSKEENIKDYVFIGGSALSYYLNHRLSEDVDLASYEEFLKIDKHIDKIMDNLFKKGFNIEEGIESSVFSASKRDFYVNNIKVTFFALGEDFLKTERQNLTGNLNIANLDTLIGMKTAVIHHRIAIRDYYDLYVITKEFGLDKAINEANRLYNKKLDNREYFKFDETNFFKFAVDLNGVDKEKLEPELNPKYDITKSEIQHFFEERIKEYIEREYSKTREEERQKLKPDDSSKDLQNRKGDMISAKDMGETILLKQRYFFGGLNKEKFEEASGEVKEMLHDVNIERFTALKETFKGISFDKELKGWVISKSDNPDWRQRLENYNKADNSFCKEKTKDLENRLKKGLKR